MTRQSLTPQQLAEIKDAFDVFDRNHDGSISAKELENVLQMLGNNPSKADIQAIMTKVDKNGECQLLLQLQVVAFISLLTIILTGLYQNF